MRLKMRREGDIIYNHIKYSYIVEDLPNGELDMQIKQSSNTKDPIDISDELAQKIFKKILLKEELITGKDIIINPRSVTTAKDSKKIPVIDPLTASPGEVRCYLEATLNWSQIIKLVTFYKDNYKAPPKDTDKTGWLDQYYEAYSTSKKLHWLLLLDQYNISLSDKEKLAHLWTAVFDNMVLEKLGQI